MFNCMPTVFVCSNCMPYSWSIGSVICIVHLTTVYFRPDRIRVELSRLPGLNGYMLSRWIVNEFM